VNAARRARQKARRTATHEHLEGTRCTICRPLEGTRMPVTRDPDAELVWRAPTRPLLNRART
jgi:hypothetical protein